MPRRSSSKKEADPLPDESRSSTDVHDQDVELAEPIDPHLLSRDDLERKIRGAKRRSRMPGERGKRGAKDLAQFKKIHEKNFPGTIIRYWDSLPPPPPNKQNS